MSDILTQLREATRELREQADHGPGLSDGERARLRAQAEGMVMASVMIEHAPRSADHEAMANRATVIDFAGISRDDVLAFDYPLTAVCARCGRPCRLGGPAEQWTHMALTHTAGTNCRACGQHHTPRSAAAINEGSAPADVTSRIITEATS